MSNKEGSYQVVWPRSEKTVRVSELGAVDLSSALLLGPRFVARQGIASVV